MKKVLLAIMLTGCAHVVPQVVSQPEPRKPCFDSPPPPWVMMLEVAPPEQIKFQDANGNEGFAVRTTTETGSLVKFYQRTLEIQKMVERATKCWQ